MIKCARDLTCSFKVLKSMANKFKKDCDQDGEITCDDFSILHQKGLWSCPTAAAIEEHKAKDLIWKRYQNCKNAVLATGQEI